MVVSGVAILGKENNPLYIRAFGVHDQLRFHFIVHTALDFVEEKGVSTFFSHYFFVDVAADARVFFLDAQSRRRSSRRRSSRRRGRERAAQSTTATLACSILSRSSASMAT